MESVSMNGNVTHEVSMGECVWGGQGTERELSQILLRRPWESSWEVKLGGQPGTALWTTLADLETEGDFQGGGGDLQLLKEHKT